MKMELKVIPAMKSLLNNKLKNTKGITLVELLIAMVLISIIVTAVSFTYISSSKTSNDVIDITRSEIDARLAIYRMSKDIREATSITLADSDQIQFLSNIDSDSAYEEIDYYLESDDGFYNLIRDVDGGEGKIIVTHIINTDIFKYFSEIQVPEDGMDLPVTGQDLEIIKLLELNVSVDQSGSQTLRTMDLDTLITIRNRI
jgi:prepilin-type N-terminal cleavage/methylation domain-containing protein